MLLTSRFSWLLFAGLLASTIPTQAQLIAQHLLSPAKAPAAEIPSVKAPEGPFPPDFGIPAPIVTEKSNTKYALEPGINVAPIIASLRLSNSSGRAVHLSLTANDANGAKDIASIYVIVQSTLTPREACFIHYRVDTDRYQLANNGATEWVNPGVPAGSPQLQSNGQCTLDSSFGGGYASEAYDASVNRLGKHITFGLQFQASFAGPRKVYAYAIDHSRAEAQWQEYASFTVSGASAPEVTGIKSIAFLADPTNRTSLRSEFGIRSPQGNAHLSTIYLIANPSLSSANSCLVEMDIANRRYRLANDAGNNWLAWVSYLPQFRPPQSPQNAKCATHAQRQASNAAEVAPSNGAGSSRQQVGLYTPRLKRSASRVGKPTCRILRCVSSMAYGTRSNSTVRSLLSKMAAPTRQSPSRGWPAEPGLIK